MHLHDVKNGKKAQGKGDLIKFLQGTKITPRRALKAKCYECMGGYADGKVDCGVYDCPLHPFMPYRNNNGRSELLSSKGIDEKVILLDKVDAH